MHRSTICALTLLLLLLPAAARTAVIRVPADQPTIQAGIDAAAHGDTVLVSDGVYTGEGNRDLSLGGKAITVRSATGPDACIIDCQGSEADPHRGFELNDGEGRDSVIEGLTIRNGHAPGGTYDAYGGAIFCSGVSPTIRGNIVTGSFAYRGGGIFVGAGEPLIEDNEIIGNEAPFGGGISTGNSDAVIRGNLVTGNSGEKGGGINCDDQPGYNSTPQIIGNTITGNHCANPAGSGAGGGVYLYRDDALVQGNTIAGNSADNAGGGIFSHEGEPVIRNNVIENNNGGNGGGGLRVSSGEVSGNRITSNKADYGGGAMCLDAVFSNNQVTGNHALKDGGGIFCFDGDMSIANGLIAGNQADLMGGGVYCNYGDTMAIEGTTITGNSAGLSGGGIFVDISASVAVTGSIFWDDSPEEIKLNVESSADVTWSAVAGGFTGEGNIDADPLFVEGPGGAYYLSQIAAGQAEQSPCVDAGDPSTAPLRGTTRTDGVTDTGVVDMGCHHGSGMRLVAGAGPAPFNPPEVRVFPLYAGAVPDESFLAYGATGFGVNVSTADLDGDGIDTLLTGPGPGAVYGPHVRGFAPDGTPLVGLSFLAYGTSRFGVNVAGGDLDGDGMDEIVTGAGPGAVFGPHVRAWQYDGDGVSPLAGVSFFAYATPKWGVNVAAGDLDGDGFGEIVTGAGPGAVYGAHVRGWDVDGATADPMAGVSYFAYGTPRYGVRVACGDVDGDGMDEIVTAPGPSPVFGSHIRGWDVDGGAASPIPGLSFFVWAYPEAAYGATVWSGADLDGDGRDDLVAGGGPDPDLGSPVSVFTWDGSALSEWFSLDVFPDGWTHGAAVAAGRF